MHGKGYIGYGLNNTFWEYDPAKNTWIETESFPLQPESFAIYSRACSVENSKALLFLGQNRATGQSLWQFE
jgi:hypothetical protein